MRKRDDLIERVKYSFDSIIASGTVSLLLWITLASLVVVGIAAIILAAGVFPIGEKPQSYIEAFWSALNMALDPGAVAEPGWAYRVVMLSVAIFGILVVSTVIGILTTGIEGKLNELRRGRSRVLEKNHSLIIGWSSKTINIVKEFILANENQNDGVIVILADRDKVEMEEMLEAEIDNSLTSRVICRRGKPSSIASLQVVNQKQPDHILF